MKKFLFIIAITAAMAVVMTACKNDSLTQAVPGMDTTGFAQFQAWKAMQDQGSNFTTEENVSAMRTSSVNKSGSMNSSTTYNAKVAKKKGWSKAAKYSAIGGGTGIVLGALVNKRNRVAGGIIGGVIGGGSGYLLGRSKDKKEGRY